VDANAVHRQPLLWFLVVFPFLQQQHCALLPGFANIRGLTKAARSICFFGDAISMISTWSKCWPDYVPPDGELCQSRRIRQPVLVGTSRHKFALTLTCGADGLDTISDRKTDITVITVLDGKIHYWPLFAGKCQHRTVIGTSRSGVHLNSANGVLP